MVTVSELKTLEALQIIDRYMVENMTELEFGFFNDEDWEGGGGWYVDLFFEDREPIEIDGMDSFGAALAALAERLQDAQP